MHGLETVFPESNGLRTLCRGQPAPDLESAVCRKMLAVGPHPIS